MTFRRRCELQIVARAVLRIEDLRISRNIMDLTDVFPARYEIGEA